MILHVIKSNIYSGAENVVCRIINGLSDREDFIYLAPHGPIEDKLKSIGLYDKYRSIDSFSISEIKKAVDELHPDIVQAHDFTASVLSAFALKGSVPLISHIHCNPLWLKKKLHPNSISYLLASKYISRILAVSNSIKEEYCYSNKLRCPITTIGNPFSIESVKTAIEPDVSAGLSSDILYVGRFNEAKNPLGFIQIIEAYKKENPTTSLCVKMVGNGELLEECKTYVSTHNLTDAISFEGFSNNVYNYMAATGILLMPSLFEGFGLVALEAMTLGKPVVCSGVGGLSDIIDDSCGYICHDTADYCSRLNTLLTDPDTYQLKSRGAISKAAAFDNVAAYLDNLESIYRSL